jgi:hypothetical protein
MQDTTAKDPIWYLDEDDRKRLAALLELRGAGLANGKELTELSRLSKKAIYAKHGVAYPVASPSGIPVKK